MALVAGGVYIDSAAAPAPLLDAAAAALPVVVDFPITGNKGWVEFAAID